MVHGAVRHLFQVLGALVLGLLITIPLFVWRLASGPIALDFLTPTIEAALTARDGSYSVKLDRTVLAVGKGRRMVEIRAVGVTVFAADSQPVAMVPEVAMSINGRALLSGMLAPNSVRVYGLKLKLIRDEAGHMIWDIGEKSDPVQAGALVARILDALIGAPDPTKPGRHLQRAAVLGADLVVEDRALGTTWHAPDADIEISRTGGGLEALAHFTLDLAGEAGMVGARLTYLRSGDALEGEIRLAGIRPAMLARLGGPLAGLAALDMPLSGTIRGHGTAAGVITDLAVDLSGDAGAITLPAPVDASYKVVSAKLRGRLTDGLTRAQLDELSLDLGGPVVMVAAVVDGLGGSGDLTIKADASVREVPFDSLPHLWPAALAPNPRAWVTGNMSKGIAHEGRITLSAHAPGGRLDDLAIDTLAGEVRGEGVTVDYLHPMPAVKNGSAVATFDTKAFRIDVKGGEVFNLKVKDGLIVLGNLDQARPTADIDLTIAGPVADALRLIDYQPLRYASALGIKPDAVGGETTARLHLLVPLLANVKLEDLSVKTHATLTGAKIPHVLMGQDMTQGNLVLDLDERGMDVGGPMVLGTIPGRLQWRENFASKGVAFRSRYVLQAARIDEAQRRLFGLEGPPFAAPWVDGPVGATVTATLQSGGKADIEAKVDLSPARMSLPGLGWHKEERTTGGAEVSIKVDKDRIVAVPRFQIVAGDLQTRGAVAFGPDGKIRRVEFGSLVYGRTDAEGAIAFRPGGGLDIAFKGTSFDAKALVSSGEDGPPKPESKPAKKDDLPPMDITASFRTLWLAKDGRLTNAALALARDDKDWRNVSLKGGVGDNHAFSLQLQPDGVKRRSIKVASDDAGAVLKAFDVYGDLVGGKLDIDAAIDDTKEAQPIEGVAHITDYSVVHAPALARLLTVAALTGIVDVLSGEGVSFSSLDAPFTLTDGLLAVKDARASGPALGLTAHGQIDMDRGRMALEGTVVPIYAFNAALGNIPVLGWLITGGQKGGGLVAFNFSMKGSTQDPAVTVNPLSALTPGFLRHVFNIFDDGSETEARQKPPAVGPRQGP